MPFILFLFFLQQHGKGSVALCIVKLYEFLAVARWPRFEVLCEVPAGSWVSVWG